MRSVLIVFVALLSGATVLGQVTDKKVEVVTSQPIAKEPRKIVMQLTSADTTIHKMLMKQVNNILSTAPDTKIEIVCHGPGLSILNKSKTIVEKQLETASKKGVDIVACQFSMKERNVSKDDLYPFVRIVEAGIIEIVDRQNDGWVYIKAG